jgi:hypothetical protein
VRASLSRRQGRQAPWSKLCDCVGLFDVGRAFGRPHRERQPGWQVNEAVSAGATLLVRQLLPSEADPVPEQAAEPDSSSRDFTE